MHPWKHLLFVAAADSMKKHRAFFCPVLILVHSIFDWLPIDLLFMLFHDILQSL
jgi:hypothetical protein